MEETSKDATIIYIPEDVPKQQVVEKWMFFLGFIFPAMWFLGSSYCGNTGSFNIWKKRCRIATTLFLTGITVTVAVVMVIKPELFGLRADYSSGAQISLSTDSAIRPGVPVTGTSNWGDVVAGLSISDLEKTR
ncbi:hypothetical protein K501DRAFT_271029 [Backusella circina FSU 941]|nr:hypothetical protein K501DRAFT_271029 [Backusella circina FSU 941]